MLFDAEQIESALLDLGWTGEQSYRWGVGPSHGVVGERGEVGEQGLEAVHRQAVRRCGRWSACAWRPVKRSALATEVRALRRRPVVVIVQHRRERLAHVPFDMIGEHAQQDVGAHARRGPMEDRPQMEIDGLERAERALDLGQALVGADGCGGIESCRLAGWCART